MNTRVSMEEENIKVKPLSYEFIEEHLDERVSKIYERYHTGKTIILDDLRYLWLKDPEGCKKITRSIIEAKSEQGEVKESDRKQAVNNDEDIIAFSKKTKDKFAQEDYGEELSRSDSLEKSHLSQVNMNDIIGLMKLELEHMSHNDLIEMWKHINEALMLKNIGDKMKYWNDTFDQKIMVYTYEDKNKFNTLA